MSFYNEEDRVRNAPPFPPLNGVQKEGFIAVKNDRIHEILAHSHMYDRKNTLRFIQIDIDEKGFYIDLPSRYKAVRLFRSHKKVDETFIKHEEYKILEQDLKKIDEDRKKPWPTAEEQVEGLMHSAFGEAGVEAYRKNKK